MTRARPRYPRSIDTFLAVNTLIPDMQLTTDLFPRALRYAVDWSGPRRALRRVLFEQPERFLHSPLDLWIVSIDRLGRRVFYLDVRRNADILDVPFPFDVVERQGRRCDAAAVNRRGND